MHPNTTVPYKGAALKEYVRIAHLVMSAVTTGPVVPEPVCPYEDPETELERATRDGWLFGMACRKAEKLHFGFANTVIEFDDNNLMVGCSNAGVMIWDGDVYTPENAIVSYGPTVLRLLVEDYQGDLDVLNVLDALDDVQQYLAGNVKAMAKNAGDLHEIRHHERHVARLNSVLKFMAEKAEIPTAKTFWDVADTILKAGLDEMFVQIDEHHS